ncbi:MAG: regulatory protein RecX [Lachnospirales bacterium]
MVITDIVQQKNNEKRYSIFIDNNFAFGITDVDVLFYKLKINETITQEKYNTIIETAVMERAKNIAFKFLGYKARTEKEVREKLKKYEFKEDIIGETISILKSYNYIDDRKYAEDFTKEKIKLNKYGSYRIKHMLYEKGVPRDIIDEIEFEEDSQLETAMSLLEKKYRNSENPDYKEKQKICGFLQRKGYSYDIINKAYNRVFGDYYE